MTDERRDTGTTDGEEMKGIAPSEIYEYDFPDDLLDGTRERGLSKNDRRFLVTGETRKGEPSDAVRANIRTRIRQRIRETIVDFWLITNYLDDHDRDLIFEERGLIEDWELREGVKNTMEFFYLGLDAGELMDFETALVSAVHDAEQARHDGPVRVETGFDVDVSEHFDIEEAYERFQEGRPLEPMEVGALLATARVSDPNEIVRLGKQANRSGLVPSSISPLLAEQLSQAVGGPEAEETFATLAHDPDLHISGPGPLPGPLRGENIFEWEPPAEDSRPATREDLPDADTDVAESDEEVSVPPEIYGDVFQYLSIELDQPITVGDTVVYEDGDRHHLDVDDADADERGADTDDDDADADGADGSR